MLGVVGTDEQVVGQERRHVENGYPFVGEDAGKVGDDATLLKAEGPVGDTKHSLGLGVDVERVLGEEGVLVVVQDYRRLVAIAREREESLPFLSREMRSTETKKKKK